MRILKCFVFTLALTSVLTLAAMAQNQSLYERLGGKESITAVVDDFAGRVLADTRINAKFAKSDPVRLKTQLVDQICAATGGPCQYTGRTMPASHANMGVTNGEFNALVEDLTATLDKFNVGAAEKDELIKILAPMKPQIVEVQSDATGTALPKKFKAFGGAKGGKTKASKKDKAADTAAATTEEKPAKGKKAKGKNAETAAPAATDSAASAATEEKPAKGKKSKSKAADAAPATTDAPAAAATDAKPAKGSKKVKEEKPAEEATKETKKSKKNN